MYLYLRRRGALRLLRPKGLKGGSSWWWRWRRRRRKRGVGRGWPRGGWRFRWWRRRRRSQQKNQLWRSENVAFVALCTWDKQNREKIISSFVKTRWTLRINAAESQRMTARSMCKEILKKILSSLKEWRKQYLPFSCVRSKSLCNMAAGRKTRLSKEVQVCISPDKSEEKHGKMNLSCITSLAGLLLLANEQLSTEELMLWMFFWCAILQRILSIFGPKLTSWG